VVGDLHAIFRPGRKIPTNVMKAGFVDSRIGRAISLERIWRQLEAKYRRMADLGYGNTKERTGSHVHLYEFVLTE